jgi:RNA polymerase sigma-70 factor (ECF subfamily)
MDGRVTSREERPAPMFRLRRHQQSPWGAATADEELVARAQAGEREAFGALYDRYLPRVYGYCYRLLGSREAAEDANTEVFMRALAALPTYRSGSFRSWLFTIAHHVITDELRRRRPALSLDAVGDLSDGGPSPEAQAIAAADTRAVLDLLPRLSADQRHVVALRLSGLSAAEIGEALGKPRNAVDGIHHRAVLRLRALVATGEPAAGTKGGG